MDKSEFYGVYSFYRNIGKIFCCVMILSLLSVESDGLYIGCWIGCRRIYIKNIFAFSFAVRGCHYIIISKLLANGHTTNNTLLDHLFFDFLCLVLFQNGSSGFAVLTHIVTKKQESDLPFFTLCQCVFSMISLHFDPIIDCILPSIYFYLWIGALLLVRILHVLQLRYILMSKRNLWSISYDVDAIILYTSHSFYWKQSLRYNTPWN